MASLGSWGLVGSMGFSFPKRISRLPGMHGTPGHAHSPECMRANRGFSRGGADVRARYRAPSDQRAAANQLQRAIWGKRRGATSMALLDRFAVGGIVVYER